MTELIETSDDYDEDALRPSLALPPLYVVRTADRCPECDEALHVYTLGCAAYHDAEDSRPVELFHFLSLIESVPDSVLAMLAPKCSGYFFDWGEAGKGRRYLMNHCRCGAKLDDDHLHGDVGAAFWPDTPDGFGQLRLFRLPIDEAIPITSSYFLGGGEYIATEDAESW